MKDRLVFDTTATLAEQDNVGAFVRGSNGTLITQTSNGGKDGLDVYLINTNIAVTQGTSPWVVGDGGGSLTVDATDLDIRDLDHAQDDVAIAQGGNTMVVNADGSINVNLTAATSPEKAEDDAHVSGDIGSFMLGVRNDTNAVFTSADGDYSPIAVDSAGRVKVVFAGPPAFAEDSAHTTGDLGFSVLAVAQATLAASVSADGDYGQFKLNSRGALWTAPVGTVADDVADTENPVKVGMRALSGALAAISTSGDRADMISDMYRRHWVNTGMNIGSDQAEIGVTSTAAELKVGGSALAGRRKIKVVNISNGTIFLGNASVTTANGYRLSSGAVFEEEMGENNPLYAIKNGGGSLNVRILEIA